MKHSLILRTLRSHRTTLFTRILHHLGGYFGGVHDYWVWLKSKRRPRYRDSPIWLHWESLYPRNWLADDIRRECDSAAHRSVLGWLLRHPLTAWERYAAWWNWNVWQWRRPKGWKRRYRGSKYNS